jgi:hypothetical protein
VRAAIGCPTDAEVSNQEAVIQEFPNGVLLYWGNDSEETMYALVGVESGTWRRYDAKRLADLSVPYTCPAPSVTPIRGFGKLLATYPDLARQLSSSGCARGVEQKRAMARESFERGSMLFVDLVHDALGNPFWVLGGSTEGFFAKYTSDPP